MRKFAREGPVFLVQYLALCESSFAAVAASCAWHVAVGVGILLFGPILFLIGAAVHLSFYISKHKDEVFEPRERPPSLPVVFNTIRGTKNLMSGLIVIRSYMDQASERGDWVEDLQLHPTLFRWIWLISDCTGKTWWFPLWSLVRRLIMTANVNFFDGPVNAVLSMGVQITESLLVWVLFPFNSYQTNLQEAFAGVTNVLTYFAIALPIFIPNLLPSWIGDMSTLVLSVVATGVAAFFAMIGPVLGVLGLLKAAITKLLGFCGPLFAGSGAAGTGGAGALAVAREQVQAELQAEFDENLEERFLPSDEGEDEKELGSRWSGTSGSLAVAGTIGVIVAESACADKCQEKEDRAAIVSAETTLQKPRRPEVRSIFVVPCLCVCVCVRACVRACVCSRFYRVQAANKSNRGWATARKRP